MVTIIDFILKLPEETIETPLHYKASGTRKTLGINNLATTTIQWHARSHFIVIILNLNEIRIFIII